MLLSLNLNKLYEEVEALWKNNPEIAETLMKTLEVAHQEQYPMLSIGDKVMSRYGEATIIGIERTSKEGEKYGVKVEEVSWLDNFIVDLSNGHWSYKENIRMLGI
jgi:hypothetical protein